MSSARSARRHAAAAAVATGDAPRPRGRAPPGFPKWDGKRRLWTNEDGTLTKAPGGKSAANAATSSSLAPMEIESDQQPASQLPDCWEEYRRAEEERRAVAARTRLMPVAGPIRQADVMPFGHEGKAGVDCRLLDESACSGAMHVRKQLRDMGMCGSMLGPGPFSMTEHLEGWAAGRLRRWSL